MNITRCDNRKNKCLGNSDCCYECSYKGWCEARCSDTACRRRKICGRLNIDAGAKTNGGMW